MAVRWSAILQKPAYQILSLEDKKKTKSEFWKRIQEPELKKKEIPSSQINRQKKDFFSRSSALVSDSEIRPLSRVTKGAMQKFERQRFKSFTPPSVYIPKKVKPISTVTKGPMQKIERQLVPIEKKEEKKIQEKIAGPSFKEKERLLKNIGKIQRRYPRHIYDHMIRRNIPLTLDLAKKTYKEYEETKVPESMSGIITGVLKGLFTFDSLYEKMKEDNPALKWGEPKTKTGKTIQNWTSFATTMLNPISPYKLLPGGKAVKAAGRVKLLKVADGLLRKKVSEKILPHAYRIVGNSIAGGINIPLLTLVDRTIKSVNDPNYRFSHGLIETKKAVLPGLVLGAALPEIGRGLGRIGAGLRKKLYFKMQGVSDKEIEPVSWAQKILKTKDLNQAQRTFQRSIDELEGTGPSRLRPIKGERLPKKIGWEKKVDNLREEAEAFNILNRSSKIKISYPRLPSLPVTTKQVQDSYKNLRHSYIGSKDINVFDSKVEAVNLQKTLKTVLGEKKYNNKVKMYDTAIKLYTDLKGAPGDILKYYNKLTEPQKGLVLLSQNLPKEVKRVANYIEKSGKTAGLQAQSAEMIKNVRDNWVNRIWDPKSFGIEKEGFKLGRKFGTRTRHTLPRRLTSILEGWSKGGELKVHGSINSLQAYKEEIAKTFADKQFLKTLQKMKTADGRPFLSRIKYDDYREVNHPNFRPYKQQRWTAEIKEQLKHGREFGRGNAFVRDGKLYMPENIYAPKFAAKDLNNMMDISALMKVPGAAFVTKYNAILKAWRLQSSFFHNWAFLRSYLLGGNIKKLKDLNPKQAIAKGKEFIESSEPTVREGIKQGLTLGLRQDWKEELLHEKTAIGKLLDKMKITKVAKDKILNLREQHADWLFGHFGSGLKAKAYMIEVQGLQKKYPNADPKALMKMAANLVNDDFGGLHLQRIGKGQLARNPTLQHVFRLLMLAPDWTESNVRSMVKAIGAGSGAEKNMYRHFWARILTKGALLNLTGNFLLNGQDTLDVYKRMYEEEKFPSIDITNIYRALGGKGDTRKYFSTLGHFLDPIKFVKDPVKSGHYKGSVLFNIMYEAMAGVDWAGRRFTTLPELLGYDREKGFYKTTKKGEYKKGDPKFGKLKGKTVAWGFRRKELGWNTAPSFILNQAFRSQPVIAQKLFEWLLGEAEGFDTILNMAGLQVRSTFGGERAAKKKGVTFIGEEKEPSPVPVKPIGVKPVKVKRKFPKYIKKGRKKPAWKKSNVAYLTNTFSTPTVRKIYNMSEEEKKKYFEKKVRSGVKKYKAAAGDYLKKLEEK